MFTNLTGHNQCHEILLYMSNKVQIYNHSCETLPFGHCLHVVYETPVLVQLVPGVFPPFWGPGDLPFQALAPHNVQGIYNPPIPNQIHNPYHPNHHHQDQAAQYPELTIKLFSTQRLITNMPIQHLY